MNSQIQMESVLRMQPSPLIPLLAVALLLAMVIKHPFFASQFQLIKEVDDEEYQMGSGELLLSLIIGAIGEFIVWVFSMVPGIFLIIGILIMALHFLR